MKKYDCVAHIGEVQAEAKAEIGEDRIVVTGGVKADLLFADILDMRLLNYTLILTMKEGEARLSKMGYDTEDFFEQLWLAFTKESKKSLFVTGDAEIFVEGDYTLEEEGVAKKGIAKLALHKDCICMIPHNITGRRIPLCFSCAPEREDFKVEISLDTREKYGFGRLGHHTEPFFERLNKNRAVTVKQWTEAHVRLENELESRMGGAADRLLILKDTGANVQQYTFKGGDNQKWYVETAEQSDVSTTSEPTTNGPEPVSQSQLPEPTLLGDATLDGYVTLSDALLIIQHCANAAKYPMNEQALSNADVFNRGDGISPMDALAIQKFDANIITSFPVNE